MITKHYESRDEWMEDRLGKITGSKLKDLIVKRGNGKKVGYYQLIADRLALPPDDENVMDRGSRLEEEALDRFAEETGWQIDKSLIMWQREDNPNIAYSPDGVISDTEVVEVKCLASARHIEALLTKKIPKDYEDQATQPFIVNDTLTTLYFVFYDPRLIAQQFFYLTVTRPEVQEKVSQYLEFERTTLAEIDEIVNRLSGF